MKSVLMRKSTWIGGIALNIQSYIDFNITEESNAAK
jgi:hypothetical protein